METPETVREFWFGSDPDDANVALTKAPLWWMKKPETDREIRERFESYLAQAARHNLDSWLTSATGRLALIILLDQFPRNIYRGTPQAFAYDARARTWCVEGLEEGADAELRPIERVFFYLPLEHSEMLEDQERAVALFQALSAGVETRLKPVFDDFLEYACRHRDLIARFGRFPHRNAILGRKSTPEEEAFLITPGSSF